MFPGEPQAASERLGESLSLRERLGELYYELSITVTGGLVRRPPAYRLRITTIWSASPHTLQVVAVSGDDDVFFIYLFLQKQKIGAKLHIPLGRYVP
jgi:hypothetical protein